MEAADTGRSEQAPLVASWPWCRTSRLRARRVDAQCRRAHARAYRSAASHWSGARVPHAFAAEVPLPYAVPLWVDDAARLYAELRAQGLPVFRWDRQWPGTPSRKGDMGPLWSNHLLQLLCHQSLRAGEVQRVIDAIQRSL